MVVADHDVDATLSFASNHARRSGYYFHSTCSLAWGHRGCRRGHGYVACCYHISWISVFEMTSMPFLLYPM
jgi:hypothetical protein